MPKPKPSQKTPRKLVLTLTALYLLTVAGLGTALLLTLHAHHAKMQQITAESQRFAVVRPVVDDILTTYQAQYHLQQATRLDACFQSEQGPFDEGRLACEVGFKGIIAIPANTSGEVLANELLRTANQKFGLGNGGYGLGHVLSNKGSKVSIDRDGGAWTIVNYQVPSQAMSCALNIEQGPLSTDILPATRTQLAVRVGCQQRATIPYFEHSEDF